MAKIFVYEMAPIDFWDGMTPIDDYVGGIGWDERDARVKIFSFMFRAMSLARDYGSWEGDCGQMYVSGLPPEHGDNMCSLIIGWKQSNNGTSFIASEAAMPHLVEVLIYPTSKVKSDSLGAMITKEPSH